MARLFRPVKSGSHWYKRDGTPCHTVPLKSKEGLRATTLTDARTLKLIPSVTNILGILSKLGLLYWVEEQMVRATLVTEKREDESMEYYIKRVRAASKEVVTDAAALGTKIHKGIENHFTGKAVDGDTKGYVLSVAKELDRVGYVSQHSELRLVNPREGYAGTCDQLGELGGIPAVVDFKSRKSKNGKFATYLGEARQLAAYGVAYYGEKALKDMIIANLYISTTEPGVVKFVEHDDPTRHYEAFLHICALWRDEKGYDPRSADT